MQREEYTEEIKNQVCDLVAEWMKEHNCHNGEHAYQDDDCQIAAIELVADLADIVGIPYKD